MRSGRLVNESRRCRTLAYGYCTTCSAWCRSVFSVLMSESDFRSEVLKMLAPLDPVPIESALVTAKTQGIPDLNYAGGWIELKWKKSWPARAATPLRIPHYTDEQRNWAKRRTAAGEEVWLLLKVRTEWFLFDCDGSQEVGNLNFDELVEAARKYWPSKPAPEELIEILRRY